MIWIILLLALSLTTQVHAAVSLNVYHGTVVRVVDGDSLHANIELWPDQIIYARIRLLTRTGSLDTPELRGRCAKEKQLALAAKAYVETILPKGTAIKLTGIQWDKYGGRIDGVVSGWKIHNDPTLGVELTPIEDLGELLVREGYAVPFDPSGKKKDWCKP